MDCKERERMADTPSIKVPLVRLVCKNSQNMELGTEFAFTIFWKFKSAFVEVVWEAFSPRTFLLFSRK